MRLLSSLICLIIALPVTVCIIPDIDDDTFGDITSDLFDDDDETVLDEWSPVEEDDDTTEDANVVSAVVVVSEEDDEFVTEDEWITEEVLEPSTGRLIADVLVELAKVGVSKATDLARVANSTIVNTGGPIISSIASKTALQLNSTYSKLATMPVAWRTLAIASALVGAAVLIRHAIPASTVVSSSTGSTIVDQTVSDAAKKAGPTIVETLRQNPSTFTSGSTWEDDVRESVGATTADLKNKAAQAAQAAADALNKKTSESIDSAKKTAEELISSAPSVYETVKTFVGSIPSLLKNGLKRSPAVDDPVVTAADSFTAAADVIADPVVTASENAAADRVDAKKTEEATSHTEGNVGGYFEKFQNGFIDLKNRAVSGLSRLGLGAGSGDVTAAPVTQNATVDQVDPIEEEGTTPYTEGSVFGDYLEKLQTSASQKVTEYTDALKKTATDLDDSIRQKVADAYSATTALKDQVKSEVGKAVSGVSGWFDSAAKARPPVFVPNTFQQFGTKTEDAFAESGPTGAKTYTDEDYKRLSDMIFERKSSTDSPPVGKPWHLSDKESGRIFSDTTPAPKTGFW